MRLRGGVWWTLALAALAGCELSEVITPVGDDVLVVEAVLRGGESTQRVVLHRALNGRIVRGEPGASVVVRGPEGRETPLTEFPLQLCADFVFPERTDSLVVDASCYATRELPVEPGGKYELRVETRAGEVARGRTRVPAAFDIRSPARAADPGPCTLPPDSNVTLVWSSAAGAWSYLISAEIAGLRSALQRRGVPVDAPERLELTGVSVSEHDTTLVIPSQLGVFERAQVNQELLRVLQKGFPPGVRAQVAVAAADRNLVNAVRGGGFNPSGSVRVSSIVGDGVGVFGSLVARTAHFHVAAEPGPGSPACG